MDLEQALQTRCRHRARVDRGRAICVICDVPFPCWSHRNARLVVIEFVRDRYFGRMPARNAS